MNDLVRVKNAAYDRYEELLLRRDAVKKEAFQYERAYTREFGDLILAVFRIKMECIRQKKTIEFCQAAANRGLDVDADQLQEYLKREMAAFQEQLEDMIKDAEAARETGTVTEAQLLQIRRIYHRLVKKIHPDINPLTMQSAQLRDLWERARAAYDCNDLKILQETEVLINKALEQQDHIEIGIPDIETRSQELEVEIRRIRETDPYQYGTLLADPRAIQEKKDSLQQEQRSYEEYSAQLEEILRGLLKKGVSLTWRMN